MHDPAVAPHDGPRGYGVLVRDRALVWYVVAAFVMSLIVLGQWELGMPAYARQEGGVSPLVIGIAFGANTGVIVALQFVVMRWLHGRRRTRALVLTAAVWLAAWLVFGASGLAHGTPAASLAVVAGLAMMGVGETLMQPTSQAMLNDLAPDALRGRYNGVSAAAMQTGAIVAPLGGGWILHQGRAGLFIGVLAVLCAAMAVLALRLERVIPETANGVGATRRV